MLARLKAIFKQAVVVGPWLIILIVASLALVIPSILQDLLTNIADASLVSRLGLIAVVYGAIGLVLYRRYPQYFERVLSKRTQKTAPSEKVPTETISKPSGMERANRDDKQPEAKAETVAKPERVAEVTAPVQDNSPDMSEDDFYAFLESVSEDDQKGSG